LTPAYDLVSTKLVIPNGIFALPLDGRRTKIRRADWLKFAHYCGLDEAIAPGEMMRLLEALPAAEELVNRSYLPPDMKPKLIDILRRNSEILAQTP
jgi:serine/threonine-protein kinase HipA